MWSSLLERIAADVVAPGLLLDVAVKGVLVLALVALATRAMRHASAAARHWVWVLGVVSMLVLPVLSATVPGWHVLPRVKADKVMPAVNSAGPAVSGMDLAAPMVTPRMEQPAQPGPVETGRELNTAGEQASPPVQVAAPAQSGGLIPESHGIREVPAAAALPWPAWLVLAWFLGSVLLLGHVLLAFVSLWSLQRRSARISDGEWTVLLGEISSLLAIRRRVDLLSSPDRAMPMTWGFWRTRVLLPEQAGTWPHEQRRAVLLHELAHARRWDCLTQVFAQVACALYWFNPLVWLAWRRMQAERERACDDLVLNTGTKASAYAEQLLHIASVMPALRFSAAAIAMARPSTLEERLVAILDPHRNRRAMTRWGVIGTIMLLAAALVPVAALKAQDSAPRDGAVAVASPAAPPAVPATQPASRLQIRSVLKEGENGAFDEMPDPDSPQQSLHVGRDAIVDGSAFATASRAILRDGSRIIRMRLKPEGAQAMERWSEANIGRRLAIVLDGKLVAALQVQSKLDDTISMSTAGQDAGTIRSLLSVINGSGGGRPIAFGPGGMPIDVAAPTTRPALSPFSRMMPPAVVGEGPTCSLDGTIYELRLPPDRIGRIDIAALSRAAATPAALEKALAELGTVKPLYRANQAVRLASDRIFMGSRTPVVTGSRTTATGQVINTVQYQQTGAIFSIAGKPVAASRVDLDLSIEVATLDDGTKIATNMQAPLNRMATIVHKGPVDAGRPFVVVSADAASLDSAGKAVAYIARITLGEPQSTTRPAEPQR